MSQKYYTLISTDLCDPWTIEFGDYERSVVTQELEDMKYSAKMDGERRKWKIICTSDKQEAVEAAVKALNNPLS